MEDKKGSLERYLTFSPLKDEIFIYPLEIYHGETNGTIYEMFGKKYIEVKGE